MLFIPKIPLRMTNPHSVGKEDMCFMKEGKSDQVSRCIESRIMTNMIDYVISSNTFEQQCVVLKSVLQSL